MAALAKLGRVVVRAHCCSTVRHCRRRRRRRRRRRSLQRVCANKCECSSTAIAPRPTQLAQRRHSASRHSAAAALPTELAMAVTAAAVGATVLLTILRSHCVCYDGSNRRLAASFLCRHSRLWRLSKFKTTPDFFRNFLFSHVIRRQKTC